MPTIAITDDSFDRDVIRSKRPVLLEFWAEWCPPCKQMAPALEEVADEMTGRVVVAKLNIDDNPAAAARFGVRSIPTMIVFREGIVSATKVGALTKGKLVQWLAEVCA